MSADPPRGPLTVATWNVHGGVGRDRRYAPARIADVVLETGADVIALDATFRPRPNGEKVEIIVEQIRTQLKKLVMADVATFEEGVNAAERIGVDVISTTLAGYTSETQHLREPDFELVEKLANKLAVPIICEGRLRSADDVRRAFDCGAFAVVVGGAITGIDVLVERFVAATPRLLANAHR